MKEEGGRYFYYIIFGVVAFAFILKLMSLQLFNDDYKRGADSYAIRTIIRHPARGNILDRNGLLIVGNDVAYDIKFIPSETKSIDTISFCDLLEITKEEFIKNAKIAKSKSKNKTEGVPIVRDISKEKVATIQEKMFKFPGYYVEEKTLRKYPRPVAALILGEVAEVDTSVTNHNPYYKPGDYIGKSGIEKSYEELLRGTKGVKKVFVDVNNVEKGSYMNGEEDTVSVQGENLTITLDLVIQEYAEQLFANKKGALVAIEPKTGEIIALVSSPTFDPNLLVGRNRKLNYPTLLLDPNKPLYNRAIMDGYPPGSTFKVMEALVGQQEGILFPETKFPCGGGFRISAAHSVGCHGHPTADLRYSIQTSCNAYYCNVFNKIVSKYPTAKEGYIVWRNYATKFGFGQNFPGIDIPNVKSGKLPKPEMYDKMYGEGGWRGMTIISLGIGQGELQANALQIANLACVVANKGYWITPHVGKKIGNKSIDISKFSKNHVGVDEKYFGIVEEGMYGAVNKPGGTAYFVKMDDIVICGKTGTAQNPHGEDHSVFMCYAPMDNPKIAIGILVENAGFGATWAAPIASLVIEKYLKKEVKRIDMENRMKNGNLMNVK